MRPEFIGLACLFHVAGDKEVVVGLSVEFLAFADALAQFVGFARVLIRQAGFAQIIIAHAEGGIGHGEIRVELNGALKERHGPGKVGFSHHRFPSEAISL